MNTNEERAVGHPAARVDYTQGGNTVKKRALITGVTGQDGSYLAELLLEKG